MFSPPDITSNYLKCVDVVQVFLWFPMQSKFDYIPPNLVSEGLHFQVERVVKLAKAARSDLSQVTGGHLSIEEQIIRNIISQSI